MRFLFGIKGVFPYRVVLTFLVLGSVRHVDLVRQLADLSNVIIAFPNLLALIGLGAIVSRVLNDFDAKLAQGDKSVEE